MGILCLAVQAYIVAIVLAIVLSWFPASPDSPVTTVHRFVRRITDPLLQPLRRVMPSAGGLDFSPMIAIIVLQLVVSRILCR